MTDLFTFGNPIETGAVVVKEKEASRELLFSYFQVEEEGEGLRLTRALAQEDRIFGLGENVRGINKRGYIYESRCSDDPLHSEDRRSLYGAHNFFVLDGEKPCFGLFVDHPGRVVFDMGFTHRTRLIVTVPDQNVRLYLLRGASPEDIVKSLRRLTGRSYIPPRWAFGYGQSRWSYTNAGEVREVVRKHRENGIALDAVYLDIDYMERYKDFTVDEKSFPDFPGLVREMKEQGVHLVPIIDAGVRIEKGYPVYEEGVEKGYFCKNKNGDCFVAGVWPGRVHFPDMLNEKAGEWFGDQYRFLLDQGIDGFWNDMNEPAIFYSEEHLQEVFDRIQEYRGKNLDIESFFAFKGMVGGIDNNEEDYKRFFHSFHGERIRHDRVHNLYGFYMTKAAGEAFERLAPDKRILLFSRSSYIGMHRYGGIWMGDNLSWWSHLLLNIHMLPSLHMCGFLYTGADLGGFGQDVTEDLLLRWLEFGIFTPLMRNHSAQGTRRQEVYAFEETEAFRNIIGIRYGLLPYLYSEYMKAALDGGMYCRPLSFAFRGDEQAARVEDQLMIGESLMVAPVYEQNAVGRYVYLPERMKMIRFRSMADREETVLEKGHHYIDVALREVVVFIRPEHIVPVNEKGVQCVEEIDFENPSLLDFVEKEASYTYYCDDGYAKDYDNPDHYRVLRVKR